MSRFAAAVLLASASVLFGAASRAAQPDPDAPALQVILLGTQGGPTFHAERIGIGTLVVAGETRLLFDAGRSVTTGMIRAAVRPVDVTRIFLTHLHSDHVISLPELLISPWASQGRVAPLAVWGPAGTRVMMDHLQQALAFDIHVRRDVDERFPAEGIRVEATDVTEGVVYDEGGVKVTAFAVDHGAVQPAFGYRVDYRGRSVALSGDTRPSANLVRFTSGVDLLVHEVGRWKDDPSLLGPPDEVMPNSQHTRRQTVAIINHHTDGVEAGKVFAEVKPRLAMFSHYSVDPSATLPLVRQHYAGAVEFGVDGMTIDVGREVTIRRPRP